MKTYIISYLLCWLLVVVCVVVALLIWPHALAVPIGMAVSAVLLFIYGVVSKRIT